MPITQIKLLANFRTFAVQSAVSYKLETDGKNVSRKYKDMQQSYDPTILYFGDTENNGFARGNFMFNLIRLYIKHYTKSNEESDPATLAFIQKRHLELQRAIALKNDREGKHDYITLTEACEEEGDTIDHGEIQITEILNKRRNIVKDIR